MRVVVLTQVPEVAAAFGGIVRECGHELAAVLAARPVAGEPAAFLESAAGADVLFPASRRSLAPLLRAYAPDVGLCGGFPWLVPQEAIDVPRLGIVNSHPTVLPKGRGPHPFAWAVRNAETEVGLTFHYMDASFDTGNVLAQTAIPFAADETDETLFPKLAGATAQLLPGVLAKLEAGDPGTPQGDGVYQPAFEAEYAVVDARSTAEEVHRQVRAWSWVPLRGRVGPVLDGERLVRTSLTPVDGARRIECADGPLWIVETAPS